MKVAVNKLRAELGPEDTRDINTTTLQSTELTPSSLLYHCTFTPFLSERRLVIVQGLISMIRLKRDTSPSKSLRSKTKSSARIENKNSETLLDFIREHKTEIPETTDLVFLETDVIPNNPNLRNLISFAEVQEFRPLSDQALRNWITSRTKSLGSSITQSATKRLIDLIGNDLWTQENELEKLSLYCDQKIIDDPDVQLVVGPNPHTTIFAAIDAILVGNSARAITSINNLLETGSATSYILVMLNRQVRLLLLAQEFVNDGASFKEIGQKLNLHSDFALTKTLQQAKTITPEQLRTFHTAILSTDYSIKSGTMTERLAIEVLITTLSIQ
ncbi:DNA polymerase III subunit delta [SAR202 cluster bacterium AD-802-E10_MRT_200m]|nr:DNA polymerase III subunit delta [SAR202 cluster bacterium AD-802-E10_MRT_200m]